MGTHPHLGMVHLTEDNTFIFYSLAKGKTNFVPFLKMRSIPIFGLDPRIQTKNEMEGGRGGNWTGYCNFFSYSSCLRFT